MRLALPGFNVRFRAGTASTIFVRISVSSWSTVLSVVSWSRRIVIVDDDPLVTSLLCSVLEREGFDARGCGSTAEARREIEEFDPDLVILDVNLGEGATGAQFGYVLQQTNPGTALMFLTRYPTALATTWDTVGISGEVPVVSKDDVHDAETLLKAIDSAIRGRMGEANGVSESDPGIQQLTRTQLEVLSLIAQGLTNEAIARRRKVSERAVEKQVKLIYGALGLSGDKDHNVRVMAARRFTRAMGEVNDLHGS